MRSLLTLTWIACLLVAACESAQRTTSPGLPQSAAPSALPQAPPPAPPGEAPVRVGLLLPLSGSNAALGQDLLDAAQLALFNVEETNIQLLPRDAGDTPEQAVNAARSALGDGAELLIGPLYGRAALAVAPLAAPLNVGVLSFSNDSSIARPGVFVLGFRPEEQIERVAAYAAQQGLARQAALAPDDAYGARAIAAWRASLARQPGASAVIAATYPAGGGDAAAGAVRRVAAVGRPADAIAAVPGPGAAVLEAGAVAPLPPPGFDALLIADGGVGVRSIASLLAPYRIGPATTRLLGTMRWQDDPAAAGDPGLRGAWLATWPPDAIEAFRRSFETYYGRQPAPLAVLAYDATALAALLAKDDRRFTMEQLTDPQGFVGGAGIFRLRPDGLVDHGLAVVELPGSAEHIVDPAPQSFAGGLARR